MNDLISRQGAIVAVKDALLTWSYMPKWRDDKIVDAVIGVESATDNNVGAKLSTLKIERAISGLTEWQKHVQTDSDIDRDISVAVKVLKAQLSTNLAEVGTDCISRQAAIKATWQDTGYTDPFNVMTAIRDRIQQLPPIRPDSYSEIPNNSDTISRQAAIEALDKRFDSIPIEQTTEILLLRKVLRDLPSAQPEIIRCKDCEYGEQDEVGRWFCRSLGCQIGNEDGSGFCADAERRE